MKKKVKRTILLFSICIILLCGCGTEDPIQAKFNKEMTAFCQDVSAIHNSMNNIRISEDGDPALAAAAMLKEMEKLDDCFKVLSNISYPSEYSYLADIAKEASSYMTTAVGAYRKAYEGGYDQAMEEYARENYSRACKRMQFILSVVRGEDPVY